MLPKGKLQAVKLIMSPVRQPHLSRCWETVAGRVAGESAAK